MDTNTPGSTTLGINTAGTRGVVILIFRYIFKKNEKEIVLGVVVLGVVVTRVVVLGKMSIG